MDLIESISKEKIENAIERMSHIKLPEFIGGTLKVDEYVKQITKTLNDEFGLLLHIAKPIKQNTFNLPIYRVREVSSINNVNLFTEYSYPPPHMVGMGRCNFPNYPVFYGSTDANIALLEVLRATPSSKEYCISIWDVNQTNDDFMFQSFLNVPLPEENVFAIMHKDLKTKINEDIFEGKLPEEKQNALEKYLTYLDYQFIINKSYSLSATLAHRCLFMDHYARTDILMYPSVQSGMKGVNLAIAPNFADNNMQIRRLYTLKVDDFNLDDNKLNIEILKIGMIHKNVILWYQFNMNNPEHAVLIDRDFKGFAPIEKYENL